MHKLSVCILRVIHEFGSMSPIVKRNFYICEVSIALLDPIKMLTTYLLFYRKIYVFLTVYIGNHVFTLDISFQFGQSQNVILMKDFVEFRVMLV